MRDLGKYRGKRKDNMEWVYGYYLVIDGYHLIIQPDAKISFNGIYGELGSFGEISTSGNKWPCEVIPETVGEFTGKKDINSEEIYAGDEVEKYIRDNKRTKIIEVIWLDRQCGFNISEGRNHWYEIVGNIHK